MQGETSLAAGLPGINVGPDTQFWWANQSVNFDPVYVDGTLWAPLRDRRGQQVDHWRILDKLLPGDLVLHYASPEVRGLSRVATRPEPAYPPRGYNDVTPDTEGKLVLTDPLHTFRVPRDVALTLLNHGVGPVTANGTLRNGYVFPIEADSALKLLRRGGLEVTIETLDDQGLEFKFSKRYPGTLTDRLATVALRAEQRFLRNQQLWRWGSRCSLCDRRLPEELLVAAHIKPRWACSEEERMDTLNVSMLACLFGCDALFELGYVVVNGQGRLERGDRSTEGVEDRVADMVGRPCRAHREGSRNYFEWHRQYHAGSRS
ncbi:HNH endonuclease [Pseudarthrobacter sp. NIBRBAC000502770]|nr:HNH endonuclease [Pseudarthrobacter sp. NIBRBAC000502770]